MTLRPFAAALLAAVALTGALAAPVDLGRVAAPAAGVAEAIAAEHRAFDAALRSYADFM